MNRKNVEDLYPLTPLQQGMLFHALHSPESAAYAEQVVLSLQGEIRPDAFAAAWQAVVDRTPALRTGFVWEGVPQPLQVVFREVRVPFAHLDWTGLGEEERERRWTEVMDEDRAAGWELKRAPLLRFTLAELGGGEWRLLLSSHHLLLDGWSMPLVFDDLANAYAALLAGAAPRLPRRPPFREYVAWLAKQDERAAETFWRGRLRGMDEPTALPLDLDPRAAGRTPERHAQETVLLPAELSAAVQEAARRSRVTANTLAQAAWAAVLARYTGSGDVVFGTTVSGRPPELPGVESTIGLFINTVPVRVRVPAAGPVAAWLRTMQEEQAEARQFEHAPLARVRSWSGLAGEAPVFETLFVFENYPIGQGGGEEGGGPPPPFAVTAGHSTERTNFPLSLAVAPQWNGLRVSATYDADRLDPDRVRALLAAYRTVLERLASGAEEIAEALEPLDADGRRRVVEEWNQTAAEYPRTSVHRLFEEQAAASPDAVALRLDSGETITYAALDERANRVARHLRSLGVGVESRVGVSMERSADLVAVLLGILKAGGAYVPLDPSYPAARLEYMRRDADVRIVLADDAGSAAEWIGDARVISLADERAEIDAQPAEDPGIEIDPEGLAYVIYTSGSTGEPKGAGVPHRAIVRLVRGQEFAFFGPGEVFLQLAPVAFDASTFEIWGALLNGGSVAIHPAGVPEPKALGDFIRRHGVTTAWLTAGLFHQVVDAGAEGFGGLRQLLAGGDVLSPAHVARAMEILPGVRLIDGYGPTEATTFTCCHTVRAEDAAAGVIPIGPPLGNARVYVLDAAMRPVPAGAPGELFIAG
ncbi:MAG TPA: condensation domain-containing protein, partial [Longimicrobium sp.]|nr:condensation domain-containing protein [Longimicrobium sp.]